MPLALRVFSFESFEPTAQDLVELLSQALRRYGRPRLFVSDQGSQFTAGHCERTLSSIPHRFGAVGRSGSIALIERFWRTLNERLRLPFFRPLTQGALEERAGYGVLHYSFYRPHRALGGGTPAEAFYCWPAAHDRATSPPRGLLGEIPPAPPFEIGFLDPQMTYPILIKAA